MSVSWSEIREAVRVNIDDRKSDLYSDQEIWNFVRRASRKVYRAFMAMEYYPQVRTQSVTIEADAQTKKIEITDDIASIRKILRVEDSDGCKVTLKEENFAVSQKQYECAFIRGRNTLGWYEPLLVDKTFTVYYIPALKLITVPPGSDNADLEDLIEDDHYEAVILAATVMALASDEHNVQTWKNEYNETMMEIQQSFTGKTEYEQLPVDYYGETDSQYI